MELRPVERRSRVGIARAAAALLLLAAGSANAASMTATWLGGSDVWSDATEWDSDPLYPCNGQGGETFDVVVTTGTVTLDLDCTIEAFTFSNGTRDGSFQLTANQLLSWTVGTLGGSGTTRATNGLAISGSSNKFVADTHTLVHAGGPGSWSQGNILLGGGGATFRNETTLDITGGGRSLSDTSDSGFFENSASGVIDANLNSASTLVTLSPGTTSLSAGAINSTLGILALLTDGTHTGSFGGAGTVRFSGGSQTLAASSSVTVADLDVSGAALTVADGGGTGYAAANTDVSAGSFSVAGVADTVTSTTASLTGGSIAGDGTFETTGSFAWTAGTLAGAATTRVGGGLAISGSSNKFVADTHTLVHAGGPGSWIQGNILLGGGGATFRNETTLDITGGSRSLSDTSDSGFFENSATGVVNLVLTASNNTVTFSPGSVTNAGTIDLQLGTLDIDVAFTQTAGTTRLDGGSLMSTPTLDFQGGTLEGTGSVDGSVLMAATLSPGLSAGQLDVDGDLTFTSSGDYPVELAGASQGSEYDYVSVTGSITLAGDLSVDFLGGFENLVSPTQAFEILESTSAAPVVGAFDNVPAGARIVTSTLDSFVVSYGAGSPFGAERVVLSGFRPFEPITTLDVSGTALGGTISIVIEGVTVEVTTTPGQTDEEVAQALADAINANATLQALGIAARVSGTRVQTNGRVFGDPVVTDPGIEVHVFRELPALSPPALALLLAALAAAGAVALRGRGRPRPRVPARR